VHDWLYQDESAEPLLVAGASAEGQRGRGVTPRPPHGRALSRISRLSPQTNTSLSCDLFPHSPTLVFPATFFLTHAHPGKDFPVGHPSSNRSRPSTLNLEFFSDELPQKKIYLVDMSILSIILSLGLRCHTLTPLEDRRPRGSTIVQELPLLDTSMRPVPTMCHDGPHVRAPDPHTPVLPQGSALIPNVTPRAPHGRACYPWQLSRISRLSPVPHRSTLVVHVHFVLTHAHPGRTSRSVTHPQIALGQARLTWSFFQMSFRKRRYTLLI
jgi:hypothetical protein